MLPINLTLFHAINASHDTPLWVVELARGASTGLPLIAGVLLAAGLARGTSATRHVVTLCLASLLMAWCAARLVRWGFPVPRPAQLGIGIQWIEHGARAGFPSMHATTTFALAMALTWGQNYRWAAAAWLAAATVAWSRVCLGVHFPSDVLAGAVLGMLCAGCTLVAAHALRVRTRGRSSAYWFHRALPWARRT